MRTLTEMAHEVYGEHTFEAQLLRLKELERLIRADERERMYGKDIDTLLFEEHRLGFEKGSRSEREACANLLDSTDLSAMSADPKLQNWTAALLFQYAAAIRARGETKCTN
jgi:hypothetical protein